MRKLLLIPIALVAALSLTACGTEGVQLSPDDPNYAGAVLFADRCSGCHTLKAAGAQGSGDRKLRVQGPNLDQRAEQADDVLYAIQNGGFSGSIMPQNIVTGEQADQVAAFVAAYAGQEGERPPKPELESAD